MKQIELWAKDYGDVFLVLLIATILRFKNIVVYDLWFDEAFTGILMRVPKAEFLHELKADPHPPLYNLITRAYTSIFGVNDFTLRLLPLIFGVLTVYFVYLATKTAFDHETGIIAAFLVAVSPVLIAYSIEARSYSFYVFTTVLAYFFLISKRTVLFAGTLLLMALTHYIAPLFSVTLMLVYFFYNIKNERLWAKARGLPTGNKKELLLGFALFTPTVAFIWVQTQKALGAKIESLNTVWIQKAGLANVINSLVTYFLGIKSKIPGVAPLNKLDFLLLDEVFWGSLLVSIFIVGTIYALFKFKNKSHIFLLVLLLAPLFGLVIFGLLFDVNIYVERYLLPSSVFFAISTAYVLKNLTSFEVRVLSLILYVILLTKIGDPNYASGMKILAKNLDAFEHEIVLTTPSEYTIARYYFGESFTKLRLQNPEDPQNTYNHWPFINSDLRPQSPKTAIYISPDKNRLGTTKFTPAVVQKDFKSYKIYTLK